MMKHILILTQPLHINYGGLLQAFALQKTVKNLGFEAATNSVLLNGKQKITVKRIWKFCINKAKTVAKVILGRGLHDCQRNAQLHHEDGAPQG